MFKWTVAGVALASVAAIASAQQNVGQGGLFPYTDQDSVARGSDIYVENCASCHGVNLEGQDNWRSTGADGRALAPPHDQTGHTWHHPDMQLFQIVKYGTAALVGNGYESNMAGYEGVLSDAEILDVMAYIKSTWPDQIVEQHNAMNAAASQ